MLRMQLIFEFCSGNWNRDLSWYSGWVKKYSKKIFEKELGVPRLITSFWICGSILFTAV